MLRWFFLDGPNHTTGAWAHADGLRSPVGETRGGGGLGYTSYGVGYTILSPYRERETWRMAYEVEDEDDIPTTTIPIIQCTHIRRCVSAYLHMRKN